jgi:hypothetical protein
MIKYKIPIPDILYKKNGLVATVVLVLVLKY